MHRFYLSKQHSTPAAIVLRRLQRCSKGDIRRALLEGRCSKGAARRALLEGRCSKGAARRALLEGRCSKGAARRALLEGLNVIHVQPFF
ncbi:hypothetical protein KZX70_24245 [Paenibacillus silvae]|nr:hypothetical protein [Paenibacillus silvae]